MREMQDSRNASKEFYDFLSVTSIVWTPSATGESGIGGFEQFSFDLAVVFSCFSNKHRFLEDPFGS